MAHSDTPFFRLRPMTEEDAAAICTWRYEPPYDLYHWPDWEQMKRDGYEFGDPALRAAQYAAVTLGSDELAGFAQFFPLVGVTRLGLGMRPDLRGRGWGAAFTRAIAMEAMRRSPKDTIDLEVLVWNERARRVYEKAGFVVTDTYERNTPTGPALFHCMEWMPLFPAV